VAGEETIEKVRAALAGARDERVTRLVSGQGADLASLIAPHIDKRHGDFEFRYLAPGKSGAIVLLAVFADVLGRVIKVGPKDLIEREERNYKEFELSSFIPAEYLLQIVGTSVCVAGRASLAFNWAGGRSGVSTLRDCLFQLQSSQVKKLLSDTAKNLFPWQRVRLSAASAVDFFKWDAGSRAAIATALLPVVGKAAGDYLEKFLENDVAIRDGFQHRRCAVGFAHGDLHGANLLVVGDSNTAAQLRIIDFGSVQKDVCPARDWAKLERDVRFRCRRPSSLHDLGQSVSLLEESSRGKRQTDPGIGPFAAAIVTIREQYKLHCYSNSDDWKSEYLYFLLSWSLNELQSNQDVNTTADRAAVARACADIATALFQELGRGSRYSLKEYPAENKDVSAFVSETRIAGYVTKEDGDERALYLDSGLYVPRQAPERAIDKIVADYSVDRGGRWASIFGDAGHGKTSLMWRIATVYSSRGIGILPIQCQQLGGDPLLELETRLRSVADNRMVVLLDTLDLLVGIDDARLGAALNQARSSGLLVMSTSRRQEIQELTKHVRCDENIELTRFEPHEAGIAIRNYVNVAYEGLPEDQKSLQFSRVWEILDHQRSFQELTFEPLILRMIFQAYVPRDIPQDVNTQRVYDKFWDERVRSDRSAKGSTESFNRGQGCELIADYIAFGATTQQDNLPYRQAVAILQENGNVDPDKTIETLISTGALRSARGGSAVSFFHQTFFEYSAGRAILFSSSDELKRDRIDVLVNDLEQSRLFRLPILKQLAIQAHERKDSTWPLLAERIERTANQVAARLALEVIGKIGEDPVYSAAVLAWAAREEKLFESVSVEIVRAYPMKRFDFAFRLLEKQLSGDRERDIYFVCEKNFAPVDPDGTLNFLSHAARYVRIDRHDGNAAFRNALMATLRAGQLEAFQVLRSVFPKFGEGLREAVFQELCEIVRPEFVGGISDLLTASADEVLAGHRRMLPPAYYELLRWLCEMSPSTASSIVDHIERASAGTTNVDIAILSQKSKGVLPQKRESLLAALNNLGASDHNLRMATSEFLAEQAHHNGDDVLDAILETVESPLWNNAEATKFLLIALRSLHVADSSGLLAILNRWHFPDRGAGKAFRAIFGKLVSADGNSARDWLRKEMQAVDSTADVREVMVGAQLLVENSPLVLSENDVKEFFGLGFSHWHASHETRRIACSIVSRCYTVAPDFCTREIAKIFKSGNPEWISATINALASKTRTALPLIVLILILKLKNSRARDLFIGQFLTATNELPLLAKAEILTELAKFKSTVLSGIDDENSQLAVLVLAKSIASHDPVTALMVAKAVKCETPATLGNLGAVYENISLVSTDPSVYLEMLAGFLRIARHRHRHIRNSLRKGLPRIEEVLKARTAVEAIKTAIKISPDWNERALDELLEAAILIPSWTQADSEDLIAMGIPKSASAVLLRAK